MDRPAGARRGALLPDRVGHGADRRVPAQPAARRPGRPAGLQQPARRQPARRPEPAQRPERPEPDQRAQPAEPPGRGQRPEPPQRRQSEQRWPGQHWPGRADGLATTARSSRRAPPTPRTWPCRAARPRPRRPPSAAAARRGWARLRGRRADGPSGQRRPGSAGPGGRAPSQAPGRSEAPRLAPSAPRSAPCRPPRRATAGPKPQRRHEATFPLAGRAMAAVLLVAAGAGLGDLAPPAGQATSTPRAGLAPAVRARPRPGRALTRPAHCQGRPVPDQLPRARRSDGRHVPEPR